MNKIIISSFFSVFLFMTTVSIYATPVTLMPYGLSGLRSYDNGGTVFLSGFKMAQFSTDRIIAHYDLSVFTGPIISAELNIPVINSDIGEPYGTFEIYSFNGDGTVSNDEWSSGTLLSTFTNLDDLYSILTIDVSSLVSNSIINGCHYQSFNFRVGAGTDRFWLRDNYEPTLNVSVPEPGTITLFGFGLITLAGIGVIRKKRLQ